MKNVLFTGACTALVTPFLDGQINYPMLEQLLRRQIDAGIQAVVIAGTTGESPTLSDTERLELFRRAKAYTGDSCKILGGTGTNSTCHTLELSMAAEKTGIDGLLVVSPYYNKPNYEGLLAHYLAVAQAVELPVILYNVPSRTGSDIPVSLYKRLSHIENISGVKEASQEISKISHILEVCGTDLPVWTGNDAQICPAISLGCQGVISVVSNLLPVETQALAKAALDGDFDTAASLQLYLQPLIDLLFAESNPIPIKAAMKMVGFDCGNCRLPLGTLSKEYFTKLERLIQSRFLS